MPIIEATKVLKFTLNDKKIFNFFNAHLLVEPNQRTAPHKVLSQNLLPLQLERFILQYKQYTL